MWCSGSYVYCELVCEGFGLVEDDELVGFLYFGMLLFELVFKL